MNRVEMLRQSVAASIKPIEEPPPTEPPPNPEPTLSEPKPPNRPRQRKSPSQAPTQSLDELAELAGQMGASLAKLSEECRSMLPRIMDEPKQQTAALMQEVRAVLGEMKEAATSLSNAAKNVQHSTKAVNGLRLNTWLCQAGTAVLVCLIFLFGFMIWQHRLIREDIMQSTQEATQAAIKAENLSAAHQPMIEQLRRLEDRLKRLGSSGTRSGSAPKPPTEAPQDSSSTNGAPPK